MAADTFTTVTVGLEIASRTWTHHLRIDGVLVATGTRNGVTRIAQERGLTVTYVPRRDR